MKQWTGTGKEHWIYLCVSPTTSREIKNQTQSPRHLHPLEHCCTFHLPSRRKISWIHIMLHRLFNHRTKERQFDAPIPCNQGGCFLQMAQSSQAWNTASPGGLCVPRACARITPTPLPAGWYLQLRLSCHTSCAEQFCVQHRKNYGSVLQHKWHPISESGALGVRQTWNHNFLFSMKKPKANKLFFFFFF